MAKITKRQEKQIDNLVQLFHSLIRAKHTGNRETVDNVIEAIREELDSYEKI